MHRAIVGDPQADGGPNPELVEAHGPIRVTPLRNMPQRQAHASWAQFPHYDQGGTTSSSPAPAPSAGLPVDTNLSSDSNPPPALSFFQDAAPLSGFNPVDLSPGLTLSYPRSDSTDLGGNARPFSIGSGTREASDSTFDDDSDNDDDNDGTTDTVPPAPQAFNNPPAAVADQAAPHSQPLDSPPENDEDSAADPDDENPPATGMDDDPESSAGPTSGQTQSPSQGTSQQSIGRTWEVSKTNTPTLALYNGAAVHAGEQFRQAADYYIGTPHSAKLDIGPMLDSKGKPQLNAQGRPQYSFTWNRLRDALEKTGASRIMIFDHTVFYTPTGTRRQAIGQAFGGDPQYPTPLTPDSVIWKNMVSAMPANRKMTVVLCGCDSGNNGGGGPSREYLNGLVDAASKLGRSVEIVGYGQTMTHGIHGVSSTDPSKLWPPRAPTRPEREIGSEFRAPEDMTGPR